MSEAERTRRDANLGSEIAAALSAEAAARDALARAEAQARADLEAARSKAQMIAKTADLRIDRCQAHAMVLAARRLDVIQSDLREALAALLESNIDRAVLTRSVQSVVARLTGAEAVPEDEPP